MKNLVVAALLGALLFAGAAFVSPPEPPVFTYQVGEQTFSLTGLKMKRIAGIGIKMWNVTGKTAAGKNAGITIYDGELEAREYKLVSAAEVAIGGIASHHKAVAMLGEHGSSQSGGTNVGRLTITRIDATSFDATFEFKSDDGIVITNGVLKNILIKP